jgi:hypothetical protein
MHSCTDVLVLLADERTERTTVERHQLQQFLANLDVPVYSLNPLDEVREQTSLVRVVR